MGLSEYATGGGGAEKKLIVNILVIKPSSLGDIVHTFPAVQLLRQAYPDATITWVVNEEYAELVELCPAVDEVILFRRRRWGGMRHWPELISFVRELRGHKYELVLDFQGLLRSSLIALASGGRRRVGFRAAREGASLLYTEKVLLPVNIKHAIDKNIFLVRSALGTSAVAKPVKFKSHHDAVKRSETLLREHGLDGAGFLLAAAPVARWESKTWPPQFFADVFTAVAAQIPDLRVWLVGTESERAKGEELIAMCSAHVKPENLMGRPNLTTLVELLRQSDALLTNDSGPMHLAAALGTPVVSMFGATDPELTGPHGARNVVFRGTCTEAPCFERQCHTTAATRCVDTVKPEKVAAAIVKIAKNRLRKEQGKAEAYE